MLSTLLFILTFCFIFPFIIASEQFHEEFFPLSKESSLIEKVNEKGDYESGLEEQINVLNDEYMDILNYEASPLGIDIESDCSYSGDSDEEEDSDEYQQP
jgi:hypothetical protein